MSVVIRCHSDFLPQWFGHALGADMSRSSIKCALLLFVVQVWL